MLSKESSVLPVTILRIPVLMWVVLGFAGILLMTTFYSGLEEMVSAWNRKEEYGYGYLIPPLTIFLIWQRKAILEKMPFHGTWLGLVVVFSGICLYVLGELSALFIIVQYAFLVTLYGVILTLVGWKVFRKIWVPLLFLGFMVPLPNFIYQGLSSQLQLISSEFGVAVIRAFGISVYLEGNVIDLGTYKLQVVEACSGLRYLFPLMALSFMAAYIFKVVFWKRAAVFLSSIPITIMMNSFRIGVIGILVDKWGPGQADGFLHYFEGWVIFMACMSILFLEMWGLSKIGGDRALFGDLFAFDAPPPTPADADVKYREIPTLTYLSTMLLVAAIVVSASIGKRSEYIPPRHDFAEFPAEINGWVSHRGSLESIILDALKLDDYIMSDYSDGNDQHVNFYIAYYASQRKGESAHSPRTCIPGGGWAITEITQKELDGITAGGAPLVVNRIVIQKGDYKQLVYYWFQGRGRNITNEYMVKWYLFWDGLTRNRTDGALVRLTTIIPPYEADGLGDERLEGFARDVAPRLDAYIPR